MPLKLSLRVSLKILVSGIPTLDEAYEMLPPSPWQVNGRSDSAASRQEVLKKTSVS